MTEVQKCTHNQTTEPMHRWRCSCVWGFPQGLHRVHTATVSMEKA